MNIYYRYVEHTSRILYIVRYFNNERERERCPVVLPALSLLDIGSSVTPLPWWFDGVFVKPPNPEKR
jgi:hypothetical protein